MALYEALRYARVEIGDKTLISLLESAQKEEAFADEAAKARERLIVSESQRESVDREAHVARISERQRFLFEKSCISAAGATSLVHAVGSCAFIEQSLSLLCPHLESRTPGSQACVLRLQADERKQLVRLEAETKARQEEETKAWKAARCGGYGQEEEEEMEEEEEEEEEMEEEEEEEEED